jgi:phage gp45-like
MISRELFAQLRMLLRPLSNRIANSIARAVVQVVTDGTKLQAVQLGVLTGEDIDDGERFQEFGFSSVPLVGAEAIVVFPNGDRGHPLVVAVDDRRHRPTAQDPGTVTVYNHIGAKITITADGDIVATPATGRHCLLGSGSASDPVALKSDLVALKTAYDAHVHMVPAPVSANTLVPVPLAPTPVAATKVKAE